MRTHLLTAAAAGLFLAAPAWSADAVKSGGLEKYLPENASTYVKIRTKNFFTADVVRKVIPLGFEKYGDQLAALAQLAKQFNPQAPDIPQDKLKEQIDELKKPETIAKAFDSAKDYAPVVVVAGVHDEPESFVVLVKTDETVTSDLIEGFLPLVNSTGQLKVKKVTKGKGKPAVFELTPQQAPMSFFMAIPEPGVICFGAKQAGVEASAKATGGGKVNAGLKTLMAKQADTDFVFAAGVKGEGDDRETFTGSLVLNKDVLARVNATAPSDEKAKEWADKFNEGLSDSLGKLSDMLGDNGKELKEQLEKVKAKADGKTVKLDAKIAGSAFEKLLSKD